MKMKLKDMSKGDKFLMPSCTDNSLCLFEVTAPAGSYACHCTNLFTNEVEFCYYRYSDTQDTFVYLIDNSIDVESLLEINKQG